MKPVRSVLENLGKTDFEGLKLKLEQNMYLWELISSAGQLLDRDIRSGIGYPSNKRGLPKAQVL